MNVICVEGYLEDVANVCPGVRICILEDELSSFVLHDINVVFISRYIGGKMTSILLCQKLLFVDLSYLIAIMYCWWWKQNLLYVVGYKKWRKINYWNLIYMCVVLFVNV